MQLLTGQREKVYNDRYSLRDTDGQPTETIEETWARVAFDIGNSSDEETMFLALLEDFKFVPGGRILAGAGTGTEATYYNCYVIPVRNESKPGNGDDSREAIFDTINRMVGIMSRGGGVGINWSTLRPNGAHLARINGTTTGPIAWMDVASKAVGAVMQGGSRRGAAMFMINDWHPDVLEFIDAKRDLSNITNANISVAISDEFMATLKEDGDWDLEFPVTSHPQYNAEWGGDLAEWKQKGYPTKIYLTVKARDLWRKLAEGAWDNGEPGVIFLDRYNKLSTAASIEKIISVNPCGEQGLGAYSVCNLGAINLDALVEGGTFNYGGLGALTQTAVRFLDNVIDKNNYTGFEESYAQQMMLRRIGLSVMGLADALIHMSLRYGSPEAVRFTEDVFSTMKQNALVASAALAKEKGAAPGWEPDMIDRPYLAGTDDYIREKIKAYGLRNLFLLTQAPTGTTSILAGVNSGIEPYFAFEYERKDRTGTHKVLAPVVAELQKGTEPIRLPAHFVTSNDLSVEDHIFMQAAAQKYIDSSVSKTINGPNEQTVDEVEKAYTLAYDAGLKSIAYFRDGCGRDQVLNKVETNANNNNGVGTQVFGAPGTVDAGGHPQLESHVHDYKRSTVLYGHTSRVVTDVGTAFITVNRKDDSTPCEVFINIGKGGTDLAELSEAIGRLISVALQSGVSAEQIRDQLFGVGGYSKFVKSLPSAIAVALGEGGNLPAQTINAVVDTSTNGSTTFGNGAQTNILAGPTGEVCPECKTLSLNHMEGCLTCGFCGYSRC